MHELDDPVLFAMVVASLEEQLGVHGIRRVDAGNECFILRADLASGPVVIKLPKDRVFSNVNDAYIDSRQLLKQEFDVVRHLKAQGLGQLPEPIGELEAEGFGALVLSFVASDTSTVDEYELGRLLAGVHGMVVPDFGLIAQEGREVPELIAGRLERRWGELAVLVPELPELPAVGKLADCLELARHEKCLLHMDFRSANFRVRQGRVEALLDWSNSLVGHPALELARVAETGETGKKFLQGYASVRPLPEASQVVEVLFRLDTAVMLALVFLSEDPDPKRAPGAVRRVMELRRQLAGCTD